MCCECTDSFFLFQCFIVLQQSKTQYHRTNPFSHNYPYCFSTRLLSHPRSSEFHRAAMYPEWIVSGERNYGSQLLFCIYFDHCHLLCKSNHSIYYAEIAADLATNFVGYSLPSNWIGYSTAGSTPQVNFPLIGSICPILGFLPNTTFPPTIQSTSYNVLSTTTPNLSTVNSLIIQSNIVNNTAMFPSSVLDSFAIGDTSFGSNINYSSSYQKWIGVVPGIYQYIDIYFTDQSFGNVFFNDSNVMISLILKQGKKRITNASIPEIPKIIIRSPAFSNNIDDDN